MVDSGHLQKLMFAGALHFLQATEMSDEGLALFWSQAGNFFQHGAAAFFLAPLAVSGNGKSVRLIADMLNKVQRGGIGVYWKGFAGIQPVQNFLSGAPFWTF